jgi:hypothetical protein
MTPNYSPFTHSVDGPIVGPRWLQWLVKVATGAAFTVPFYWLGGAWWALGVAVGSLLICKSFDIVWFGAHSTWTPQGWTPWKLDFAFDATLNLLPWLLLAGAGWPVWLVVTAVLCSTYPYASP